MRPSKAFLLCLWLFQLAPQGARAQTIQVASASGVPIPAPAIPTPPASLDANIANLLRDTSSESAFNLTKNKLSDSDLSLLTQNNYRLQPDGTVLPPYADTPVGQSEMNWLLQELTGRQRLKALLQLNLIFNQYGYKNLPENALNDVRHISRQNWAILPKDIRSDLRKYFTAYELDALDQHLPALKSPTLWLNPELPKLAAPAMPKAIFVAPSLAAAPPIVPVSAAGPVAVSAASSAPVSAAAPAATPAAPATSANAIPSHSFVVSQPVAQPKLQAVLPSQFPSLPLPQAMAATAVAPTAAQAMAIPAPAAAPPAPAPANVATSAAIVSAQPPSTPAPTVSVPAPAVVSQPPAPMLAAAVPSTAAPVQPQTVTVPAIPSPAAVSAAQSPISTALAPAAPAAFIPIQPTPAPAQTATPAAPAPNFVIQRAPKPQPAEPVIPPSVASAIAAATAAPATAAAVPPHTAAIAAVPIPPVALAVAAPAAPPATEIGEYPDISPEAANKFLADAPYGHEVTDLLKLIANHAPDDLRRTAFGVLMRFLPQIVTDPARAGEDLRAATHKLNDDPYQAASTLIVLNRGPFILRERNFIFSATTFLMPSSQEFYSDRGATLPAMQALSNQNPPLYQKDIDWGKLEAYADGSERLKFSPEEMAGTLLYQLLKLDSHLRRWDADLYRTELRSRSAQFRFYYKLHQDTQMDVHLSLDLKTEYAQWLECPDDYTDFVLQTLAAPKTDQMLSSMSGTLEQRSAWSRRHDLSVLSDAKLALSDEAQKLLSGPAPVTPDLSEQNAGLQREIQALNQGSSIGNIWVTEEQRFREELNAKH